MGAESDGGQHVWVVSELYYPEESATGYYLTGIAEGLARAMPVGAITGQPTYAARGQRAPARELRNGVRIVRCWSTTFPKDVLWGRTLNLLTFTLSAGFTALRVLRAHDHVLVVTNPPTVPFAVALACTLRRARCTVLVHDVYPDAMVAAGMIRPDSLPAAILTRAHRWLYRAVHGVIVLGRDMEELVRRRAASVQCATTIIENWADTGVLHPVPLAQNTLLKRVGLSERLVLQYSGNMGRTHDLESLVKAAVLLRDHPDVRFLLIGSGAKKEWLRSEIHRLSLTTCTLLDPLPREELLTSLNACDIALIAFLPGMSGVSVPSRMYNIMAVGKPILAMADPESELARVIREEGIGWVVDPGDSGGLVRIITEAARARETLAAMGERARAAAAGTYSYEAIIRRYTAHFGGRQPGVP